MNGKDVGGVAFAFVGFVLLVGALKGTWRNGWAALTGSSPAPATAASTGVGATQRTAANLPGSNPNMSGGIPTGSPFQGAVRGG